MFFISRAAVVHARNVFCLDNMAITLSVCACISLQSDILFVAWASSTCVSDFGTQEKQQQQQRESEIRFCLKWFFLRFFTVPDRINALRKALGEWESREHIQFRSTNEESHEFIKYIKSKFYCEYENECLMKNNVFFFFFSPSLFFHPTWTSAEIKIAPGSVSTDDHLNFIGGEWRGNWRFFSESYNFHSISIWMWKFNAFLGVRSVLLLWFDVTGLVSSYTEHKHFARVNLIWFPFTFSFEQTKSYRLEN